MSGRESLIERLLTDRELRRRFRSDPVAVAREAGLPELAEELGRDGARDGRSLDVRESKSSAAGVLLAAALEGLGLFDLGDADAAAPAAPPPSAVEAALPPEPELPVADVSAPAGSFPAVTPAQAAADLAERHRGAAGQGPASREPEEGSDEHDEGDEPDENENEGQDEIGEGSRGEDANDDEGSSGEDEPGNEPAPEPATQPAPEPPPAPAPEPAPPPAPDPAPPPAPDPAPPAPPPVDHPATPPPELPVDPSADEAARHLAEVHYGFVRDAGSTPDFGQLKAAGCNGILFHANDPHLGEAIVRAREAGMQSVGIWAPANAEPPATFAHRLAGLEQYKPDIVVPDVEFEGKGVPGTPEWQYSEEFANLYRQLVPNQRWAVTVMPNQDDFNYSAYTSRGAQVWPQAYGATYETTFDPKSVVDRVAANGVDPRLINPVLAPNQAGEGLANYASYALEDFEGKFPGFVPRARP